MDDLFAVEESLSPRMAWAKKHRLITVDAGTDSGETNPWSAIREGAVLESDINGDPVNFGIGATEEEALANWAELMRVPHWSLPEPVGAPLARPSSLPKLLECGQFQGGEAGEAAARGTRLDEFIRLTLAFDIMVPGECEMRHGEKYPPAPRESFPPEDLAAADWAIDSIGIYAAEEFVESREGMLKVDCGIAGVAEGTADLLCEARGWSGDIKSGQHYDYTAQQAAYALGFMRKFDLDEWVVYLFYMDLQMVEALRFTATSAEELIRRALAQKSAPPRANDFCGWCAARFNCPARREFLGLIMPPDDLIGLPNFEALTGEQLRDLALATKAVEDFGTEARRLLLEKAIRGSKPAGVTLITKKGTLKFPHDQLGRDLKQLGFGAVLAAYGDLSAAKAKEIYAKQGIPFPEEACTETAGSSYVTVKKPKSA
jgi:hypothetical protein